MKLPNGKEAIVDDAKLLEYVLNPDHPVGRHHAVLFDRLLGIRAGEHRRLKLALFDAAVTEQVMPGQASEFGAKFEMRFLMEGPQGARTVLAVWLIEHGSDRPRLVTCYVE